MKGLANRLRWGVPILIGVVALLAADVLGWSDGYGLWILCLMFGTTATYEAISWPLDGEDVDRGSARMWAVVYLLVTLAMVKWGAEIEPSTWLGGVIFVGTLVSTSLTAARTDRLWQRLRPLLTIVWLSIPMACALLLTSRDSSGFHLILCTILMVKGCDTGAYFVGRKFGKIPLHPVSPRKTIEGLVGGIVTAAAIGYLYSWQLADPGFSPQLALFFGVVVAVVGQISDLQESAMKRRAGQKDSGSAIPGLGGALDMVDSLVLVMPTVLWLREFLQ